MLPTGMESRGRNPSRRPAGSSAPRACPRKQGYRSACRAAHRNSSSATCRQGLAEPSVVSELCDGQARAAVETNSTAPFRNQAALKKSAQPPKPAQITTATQNIHAVRRSIPVFSSSEVAGSCSFILRILKWARAPPVWDARRRTGNDAVPLGVAAAYPMGGARA